jgi:tetratricopeptide (TPR) repeat protein
VFFAWQRSRQAAVLAAVFIVIAGVAAYSNSFNGAMVGDDLTSILENQSIRRLWPPWGALSPPRNGETVSGRPLLNLSLAVNYAVGGTNVWGYHAVNLAIHIFAAITLFGVLRRTLCLPKLRARYGDVAILLAGAIALIWTAHPLQTESVTYIVQRAESLCGLCYLLVLYCVVRGATSAQCSRETIDGRVAPARFGLMRERLWYSASIVFSLIGMATKEVMVTAPVVILLYDRVFLAGTWRGALRRRGLYLGLAATWLLLGVLVWSTGLLGRRAELGAPDMASYAAAQPLAIQHYVWLSVWPHPLCHDYHGWPIGRGAALIVAGGALAAGVVATTVGMARGSAWSLLGAWFIIILMPTSSFLPLSDVVAEHRMYLPLASVITAVIVGGYETARFISDRMRVAPFAPERWIGSLSLAITIVFGTATWVRNIDYRSDLAIWECNVATIPTNDRAQNNLGFALVGEGRLVEAIFHYRAALKISPGYAVPYNNLGDAIGRLGRLDESIDYYRRSLELRPSFAVARSNLARALSLHGKTDDAIVEYWKALENDPSNPDTHNDLGVALAQRGRLPEAIAQFQAAVERRREFAEAHNNLGNAFLQQGNWAGAVSQYQAAIGLGLDSAALRMNLAKAFSTGGRFHEAVAQWLASLRLAPDNLALANTVAWLLATHADAAIRNGAEAVKLAEHAATLSGRKDPAVLDTLAAAYAEAGRFDEAVKTAQQARSLAESQHDAALAEKISARLKLYRSGKPCRG